MAGRPTRPARSVRPKCIDGLGAVPPAPTFTEKEDWQYDIVNGSRSWVCRDVNNEREFLLEVEANGASRAQKTMLATKRTTAIKDCCKPELKSADIKRFSEEHP